MLSRWLTLMTGMETVACDDSTHQVLSRGRELGLATGDVTLRALVETTGPANRKNRNHQELSSQSRPFEEGLAHQSETPRLYHSSLAALSSLEEQDSPFVSRTSELLLPPSQPESCLKLGAVLVVLFRLFDSPWQHEGVGVLPRQQDIDPHSPPHRCVDPLENL